MDRLHLVGLVFAALLACCDSAASVPGAPAPVAPPVQRFEAVRARPAGISLDSLCDVRPAAGASGPRLALPALASGEPPAAGSWRWINVWATWCAPCVEEIPRIARWREELARSGIRVDVAFLSVDSEPMAVSQWARAHPEMGRPMRVADPGTSAAFFRSVGLDAAAPIPVHVFVDATDSVRCARSGPVRDQDFAAVRQLLGTASSQ